MDYEDIPFFKEYSEIKGQDVMERFVEQLFDLGHDEEKVKGFVINSYRAYKNEERKNK